MLFQYKKEISSCPDSLDTTSLKECGAVSNDIEVNSYCFSKNILYALDKDSSALCFYKYLTAGSHITTLDGKSIYDLIITNSGTISVDDTKISNMAFILCYYNSQKSLLCGQTSGIFLNNKTGKYYSISNKSSFTNTELDISGTSCSSNIGKLITLDGSVSLCISDENSISFPASDKNSNHYFMNGSTANGSPFTTDNVENGIMIKSYPKYFINDISKGNIFNFQ